MVLPKMVDHTFIRTILAVVLHRKDPKQYLLINMNLHFKKRWSPYFLSDFFFQFKCDVPTDGFENRIPRIASKSILLVSMINIVTTAGRWFTSHFFSIFGKLFLLGAWLGRLIYLTGNIFFFRTVAALWKIHIMTM